MSAAVRYRLGAGAPRIGRQEGDLIVDVGPAPREGFVPTAEAWRSLDDAHGVEHRLADVRLLHPVVPGKVLCIGTNYRGHAEETGRPMPVAPIVFAKLPSALIGPGEPIVIPFDEPATDYEAEVALVIGKRVRRADRAAAREAIGGVTAFNDVSGRTAQLGAGSGGQFTLGKSFDTFGPLGPAIVGADDLELADIGLRCVVSGEELQKSTTRQLIFDAETLVMHVSAAFTLFPGDVIATGTPDGVGHARSPQRYLCAGDLVEVHVDGVGVLRNPVIAEPLPGTTTSLDG